MTRIPPGTYQFVDPDKPCPTCHAAPRIRCRNPVTGQDRRVPCVKRPRIGIPGLKPDNPIDAEVVDIPDELDFSEPRHPIAIERTANA